MGQVHRGKQNVPRDSLMSAECTNEDEAMMKVGQTQSFELTEGDAPPRCAPGAPKLDQQKKRGGELVFKEGKDGKKMPVMEKEGWLGKAEGRKQTSRERGLWKEGTTADGRSSKWAGEREDTSAAKTLAKCRDFASEESALKKFFEEHGHALVMSPKGHSEVAGSGTERSWGKTKRDRRRMPIEQRTSSRFCQDLNKLFHKNSPPLERTWKCAREARDCRRTCQKLAEEKPLEKSELHEMERMMAEQKCHRSVLSSHVSHLRNAQIDNVT
eukprot:jgi/Bigna1/140905/aug1.59_g15613